MVMARRRGGLNLSWVCFNLLHFSFIWAVGWVVGFCETIFDTDDVTGRETFLVKVDWVDDWPVFNDGKNISLLTQGRNPKPPQATETPQENPVWTADLKGPDLELGWYQKSEHFHRLGVACPDIHYCRPKIANPRIHLLLDTPLKQSYSLTARPGHLRLYGNCYDLSSPEAPAMLLRKQTSYTQTFETTLDFTPSRPGYEAGLVLWWNVFSYATVGVTLVELPDGEKVQTVVRRSRIGKEGSLNVSLILIDFHPRRYLWRPRTEFANKYMTMEIRHLPNTPNNRSHTHS